MDLPKNPIICAIDTNDLTHAISLSNEIGRSVGAIKLGLEFYLKFGIEGVKKVTKGGEIPLFLDLKLHDIPNTVAGAIRSCISCHPFMLTVHASGGIEMMVRAKEQAIATANEMSITVPQIIGVTLLTSLDNDNLNKIGFKNNVTISTQRLTNLAKQANIDGIVCSGHELEYINKKEDNDFIYVTPGIRLLSGNDDQKRIVSPGQAMKKGSSFLVIGREITQSKNKKETIEKIKDDIDENHR